METINLTFIKSTWMQPLSPCTQCALCPLCNTFPTRLWALCKNQRFHFLRLAHPSPWDILGVVNCSVACSYPSRTTPTLLFYFSAAAPSVATLLRLPEALTLQRVEETEGYFKLSEFLAKIIIVFMALIKAANPFLKVDLTTHFGFKWYRYLV